MYGLQWLKPFSVGNVLGQRSPLTFWSLEPRSVPGLAIVMASLAKEWVRPYYLKWGYSRLFSERYPREFTRCWEYPARPLDSTLAGWMEEGGEYSERPIPTGG